MYTRELERWLSDKEHLLLLERTRVWFPALSSWLTTACNSNSQKSNTFSWLQWDPHTCDAVMHVNSCRLTHIHFFFNLYYPWTKEREYSAATPGCKSHSLLKCNSTTTLLVQAHRRKKKTHRYSLQLLFAVARNWQCSRRSTRRQWFNVFCFVLILDYSKSPQQIEANT